MTKPNNVIIIGAGISGLAAAAELGKAGLQIIVLEARNRIGGRIYTTRDPATGAPVEMGAEFIHGKSPEIWNALETCDVPITEVDGQNWCHSHGQLTPCSFFEDVDEILEGMDDSGPDESFLSFLQRRFPNPTQDSRMEEAAIRFYAVTSFSYVLPTARWLPSPSPNTVRSACVGLSLRRVATTWPWSSRMACARYSEPPALSL